MPILQVEPGLFPPGLFEASQPPHLGARVWWVVHTRPRQEKSLARHCHEQEVPFFLPLVSHRRRFRGRTLTSHVPLFSSYVFLQADADERLAALGTARVVQMLKVVNQGGLWGDLQQIHRLLASGSPVTPEEKLAPGKTVEIRSGPLAGLQGKILRTASGRRFVVEVNFIQRGASVLLDDFTLVEVK